MTALSKAIYADTVYGKIQNVSCLKEINETN